MQFPIVSVSNVSWAKLAFSLATAGHGKGSIAAPVTAHIVPLKCGPGGVCKPTLDEEKELVPEVSWGTARFKAERSKEVRSFEFLTSNFGGRLPDDHEPLPVMLADPLDGCTSPVSCAGSKTGCPINTTFVLAFSRGGCPFSVKQQHAQDVGARLALVFEKESEDNALQRVGGLMPEAGYIGIPSILVSAPAGAFLRSKSSEGDQGSRVTLSLVAGSDSSAADRWIELAFTEWAEGDDERLLQIEGLIQKHIQAGNVEMVSWLQRKAAQLESKKSGKNKIPTDEL